ncbi:hypothetical protein HQ590_14060, partial [bacterium]|nr:hypothetical protein [bacterium]
MNAFSYFLQAEDFTGVVPAPAAGSWGEVAGTYLGGTAIRDDTTGPGESVSYIFHVPTNGTYYVWIAHLTDTNEFTTFDCAVEQDGSPVTNLTYAAVRATATRDDGEYVYRSGSWEAWSVRAVWLPRGEVTLKLAHNAAATMAAVVDALQVVGISSFTPDWNETGTKPFSYLIEAEDFDGGTNTPVVGGAYQWVGSWWNIYAGYAASGGREALAYFSVSDDHPLSTTLTVPKAGTYHFWMAHNVNPGLLIPEVVEVIQGSVTVTNFVFGPHTPQNDRSDPDYYFQNGTWRVLSVHAADLVPGPVTVKVYYNHPDRQSYGMWD